MRIVGGSLFGELSGKAGGLVASRNKGGQYLRQYVIPTDPRSDGQIDARARFGASSSSYHGMLSQQKAEWQAYANSGFNTPFNSATGVYSGFNAFVSLKMVVNQSVSSAPQGFTCVPTGATPGSVVQTAGVFSYTPPTTFFSTEISNGTDVVSNPPSQILPPINGNFTRSNMSVQFTLPLSIPSDNPSFENSATQEFGLAVYMSNAVQQRGLFIANPYHTLLWSNGHIDMGSTGTYTQIVVGGQMNSARVSSMGVLPSVGDWVQISVLGCGKQGQLKLIGAYQTSVQ